MGRSQVLYNRTKGRYKNRGQQSQHPKQSSSQGTISSANRPNERPSAGHVCGKGSGNVVDLYQGPLQPVTRALSTISAERLPNIDESILLAEPSYFSQYPKDKHTVADTDGSLFVGDGSIDIPSMAATLAETLKVAQRLKVPQHVAQALHHTAASVQVASLSQNLTAQGNAAITLIDDVLSVGSFSVAQMKLRVGSDGNVEIRPKSSTSVANSGGLAPFPEDSEIDSSTAGCSQEDKYGSNYLDPIRIPSEYDDYVEEESPQAAENYASSNDEDQDRYFVGHNHSSLPSGTSEDVGDSVDQVLPQNFHRQAGQLDPTPYTIYSQQRYGFVEPKKQLEDWLDNVIDAGKQQRPHPTRHHLILSQGGRYIVAESPGGDYSTITSAATASRTTETVNTCMPPSRCYTVDSRGKLFEEDSCPEGNVQASKRFEPAKKGNTEDLDAWLDSVIS